MEMNYSLPIRTVPEMFQKNFIVWKCQFKLILINNKYSFRRTLQYGNRQRYKDVEVVSLVLEELYSMEMDYALPIMAIPIIVLEELYSMEIIINCIQLKKKKLVLEELYSMEISVEI